MNVPTGVWIDERGLIVRRPEPAFPWRPRRASEELLAQLPPIAVQQLREAEKMRIDPDGYVAALRDWVDQGDKSRYALTPAELVARSRSRNDDQARAAACFELAQHLERAGHHQDAVRWFREAHRLQPDNWTYKRQAWSLSDTLQGPTEDYDSDWLSEVRRLGAENYYPALELE